jgi:ribosomal-protein-alanine N-acetyltransferase
VIPTLRFESLEERFIPRLLEIESQVNSAPWSERAFRNELENVNSVFTIALVEGRVVGYGSVWLLIDEAHITTVAVDPSRQRHGIGTRMVRDLLNQSKSKGMECSTLEVRAGNQNAIRLYERFGFRREAVRKRYYPDNQEDAVVMWLYDLQAWESPI